MDKNIAIIGGDKRNVYLAKLLEKEGYKVNYIGEKKNLSKLEDASIVIGPIPFTKDGENVYGFEISIADLIKYCEGKKLIAGAITNEVYILAEKNNVEVIDLMQNEELTVLNTIATAEGTIEIAMKNTEKTIQGSNILILGFGRVAKVTAQKFSVLFANVTCAARKAEAFAWIETNGFRGISIKNMDSELNNFDIIINTVPTIILNKERLKNVKKDCLIIDLASKPGGIDRIEAQKQGINFKWALALPGKVAPFTSAEYIKRVIVNFLN